MAMCIGFGLDIGTPYVLEDKKFLWLLGSAFVGSTIFTFIICTFTSKLLVKILEVPYWIYASVIMTIIIYTCQTYTGLYMDYLTLGGCTLLGIFCKHYGVSRPAILLTYIIIDKWENLGGQMMQVYDWPQLLTRPLFLFLCALVLFLVYKAITQKNRGIDYW
jgi:TctA family transporter